MTALAATSRTGWSAAIGSSLLLHAALAAALVPLLQDSTKQAPPTAITFSEPPPDVIVSLPQRSETLVPALRPPEPVETSRAETTLPAAMRLPTVSPLQSDAETAALLLPGLAASPLAPAPADRLPARQAAALEPVAAPAPLAQASSAETLAPSPAPAAAPVSAAEVARPATATDVVAALPPSELQPATAAALAQPDSEPAAVAPLAPATIAESPASAAPLQQLPAAAALDALSPDAGTAIGPVPLAGQALQPDYAVQAALPAGAPALSALPPAWTAAPLLPSSSGAPVASASTAEPSSVLLPAGAGAATLQAAPVQPGGSSVPSAALAPASGTAVAELAPIPSGSAGEAPAASSGTPVLQPLAEAPQTTASAAQAIAPAAAGPAETGSARRAAQRRHAIAFVRDFSVPSDCFAVLPAQNGDGIGFDAFSRDSDDMQRFAEAARALGRDTRTNFADLSAPQCRTLVFARGQRNYPDFTLGLTLDRDIIPDHARLAGRILGAGQATVRLFLIDDEGTVQSLDRFLSAEPEPAFSVPMNLTDGQVRTKQLLLAVTSDEPLLMLRGEPKDKAPAFFRQLQEEARLAGAKIDLALRAFSVEAEVPETLSGGAGENR